ncbi:zinc finger MYM-type protein 1-like [Aphis craccivora]|uniref:Zinc finger MYM-type protein 1-like n=1 Tax=Aphis craccivora TaxID=307492 RepID=A0A6G0Y9M0_APHCR|nr:zinc finger MYM-type protein 1-like [Aphis craccivora]
MKTAKQGLAFRGKNETNDSVNKGYFIEILETFGDEKMKTKLQSSIHEMALGCFHMKMCNAQHLAQKIFKIIGDNNLDINKCVGQCYDGA